MIRSNRANALAGYYNTAGTNPQCAPATASGSETAGRTSARTEVNAWLGSLKGSMVSAANAATDTSTCGGVSCVANTIDGATCTITVQWDDSRGTGTAANREGSSQRARVSRWRRYDASIRHSSPQRRQSGLA